MVPRLERKIEIGRDIKINPKNNRCPLSQIKNSTDWVSGYDEGHKYWENGEVLRKKGCFTEAISYFDKARENGYFAPVLYESYAKLYRKIGDFENEIDIIDEAIFRNLYEPIINIEVFEKRRNKAVALLLHQRQKDENL